MTSFIVIVSVCISFCDARFIGMIVNGRYKLCNVHTCYTVYNVVPYLLTVRGKTLWPASTHAEREA